MGMVDTADEAVDGEEPLSELDAAYAASHFALVYAYQLPELAASADGPYRYNIADSVIKESFHTFSKGGETLSLSLIEIGFANICQ